MEVCVESVASALNAEAGGAIRIELCCNLAEGGTTPTVGMLRVIKDQLRIPVFVMIRPRGGDFLYSDEEFEVMKLDLLALKEAGADGIVLGILQSDGRVDKDRSRELINLSCPLPVTFHRAIDMTKDIFRAMDEIIAMGCERILTSGQESSALEGLPTIKQMVEQARDRITIIPGGGITERNVNRILQGSGAREFHCSARMTMDSDMIYRKSHVSMGGKYGPDEYALKVTDVNKVRDTLNKAQDAFGYR
ncbi:copper homeostasis protein cutC homolog [Tubulanus polymorphus]|uniref:copper homeostasis protein cutC homolog n=1 Tax=Tubulanus polymorphus TaxID=672921 RepID=UPI003DA538CC